MVWNSQQGIKITMATLDLVHRGILARGGIKTVTMPIWTGSTNIHQKLITNQIHGTTLQVTANLWKQQGWWYVRQMFKCNLPSSILYVNKCELKIKKNLSEVIFYKIMMDMQERQTWLYVMQLKSYYLHSTI